MQERKGDSMLGADAVHRLFDLSVDMLGTASMDGYFTGLNAAGEGMLGWTREELMAEPYISFVHPEDVETTLEQAALLGQPGTRTAEFENRYRTRDGDYRWLHWTAAADDGVVYFVAQDITARRAAETERDLASRVNRAITESVAEGLYVTDSDGLVTEINTAAVRLLGYQSADELLGREAHATLHHTRWDGSLYPIENCPLLPVTTTGQPVRVEEDTFWRKDGTPLSVSYSSAPIELPDGIGSAVAFRDITVLQAERARIRAQTRHAVWFERVHQALAEGHFVLYGQPIIELGGGTTATQELLLRMRSPAGEIIAPGLFLPTAEKHGLIHDVDRWVATQAVELVAAGGRVTANLSAESVGRIDILLHIERQLARTGASPERLTFEVTETAFMENLQEGRRFVDRLVALGCSFSLDDFGTGYGSLTYLRQLAVTYLKIDVQFVREMAANGQDRKLVAGIVHIAQTFGKKTIAEGVEDERTLVLLRDLGVDFVQGYYLGRPAPLPPRSR
jgi:PAS domain S-box-containing protein